MSFVLTTETLPGTATWREVRSLLATTITVEGTYTGTQEEEISFESVPAGALIIGYDVVGRNVSLGSGYAIAMIGALFLSPAGLFVAQTSTALAAVGPVSLAYPLDYFDAVSPTFTSRVTKAQGQPRLLLQGNEEGDSFDYYAFITYLDLGLAI